MSDELFKVLLAWFMVSDPWPLSEEEHKKVEEMLDEQSRLRGFDDWIAAYHEAR